MSVFLTKISQTETQQNLCHGDFLECLPVVPQEMPGVCSLPSMYQEVRETVIYRRDEGKVEGRLCANKSLRLRILGCELVLL